MVGGEGMDVTETDGRAGWADSRGGGVCRRAGFSGLVNGPGFVRRTKNMLPTRTSTRRTDLRR